MEGFMSEDKAKSSLLFLKEQNKKLKKELRFYKAKLKDTQESRELWKAKYKAKEHQAMDRRVSVSL